MTQKPCRVPIGEDAAREARRHGDYNGVRPRGGTGRGVEKPTDGPTHCVRRQATRTDRRHGSGRPSALYAGSGTRSCRPSRQRNTQTLAPYLKDARSSAGESSGQGSGDVRPLTPVVSDSPGSTHPHVHGLRSAQETARRARAAGEKRGQYKTSSENLLGTCRVPAGYRPKRPVPARLLNPAGASRGYIPDGHRPEHKPTSTNTSQPQPTLLPLYSRPWLGEFGSVPEATFGRLMLHLITPTGRLRVVTGDESREFCDTVSDILFVSPQSLMLLSKQRAGEISGGNRQKWGRGHKYPSALPHIRTTLELCIRTFSRSQTNQVWLKRSTWTTRRPPLVPGSLPSTINPRCHDNPSGVLLSSDKAAPLSAGPSVGDALLG
ncbi:hypothetical protein Bbelb_217390 [Branchiostoma belcheri]|nr:hypothetical protein Bbelb_217390 [Branchiostoma belcheri]